MNSMFEEIILPIKFVPKEGKFSCGQACVQMCLNHFNLKYELSKIASVEEILSYLKICRLRTEYWDRFRHPFLYDFQEKVFKSQTWVFKRIVEHLKSGSPIISYMKLRRGDIAVNHFVVISGVQLTEKGQISGFYILDPDNGVDSSENQLLLNSFMSYWLGCLVFVYK